MAVLIFAASAAFILYVLFGYPLLLGMRARLRPNEVRRRPVLPSVTILLPVWNGEPWLRDKLRSILRLDYPRELLQVIVISDGSTDRTEAIAQEFASRGVELIPVPHSGKASAINAGLRHARGDILFFTDVRQRLDARSLRALVECFADDSVGVASGELVILEGSRRQETDVGLYWQYEKWIRKRQSRIDSVMGATGSIYAMRRCLAVPLPPDTLLDDVYLPLSAFFRGYRTILDERAKAFDSPTSLETEFGRKVRTLAGVYQVMRAYPALLGPSNRMWIDFVSHKLGRLLLPYALIALGLSGLALPYPWWEVVTGFQAAFYALAVTDLAIPECWKLKRVSSPARTFVVLVAAALCAAWTIFRPGREVWKETRATPLKPSP